MVTLQMGDDDDDDYWPSSSSESSSSDEDAPNVLTASYFLKTDK